MKVKETHVMVGAVVGVCVSILAWLWTVFATLGWYERGSFEEGTFVLAAFVTGIVLFGFVGACLGAFVGMMTGLVDTDGK